MMLNEFIQTRQFNEEQLKIIKRAINDGFTISEVKIFAKPIFSANQMYELYLGIKEGLTVDEVSTYAYSEINCLDMEKIRKQISLKK